jgi:hypothetical protein
LANALDLVVDRGHHMVEAVGWCIYRAKLVTEIFWKMETLR